MDVRRSLLGPMVLVMLTLFAAPAAAVTCDGSWSVQPVPALPGGIGTTVAQGLAAGTGGDAWVAGTVRVTVGSWRGVVAHRHSGRWQVTTLARQSMLDNIATAGGAVWATGQRDPDGPALVLRLVGTRWTEVAVAPADSSITGVALSAPDNVWLSGTRVSATGSRQALALHFDGRTWRQFLLPPGEGLGVATSGSNDAWVVGKRGTSRTSSDAVPASWHWNGRTWQQELLAGYPAADQAGLTRVRALPDGTVWASGRFGLGNCCNHEPIVAQHVAGGWQERTGTLGQADGFPTGILVGPRSARPTVVGSSFVGDSGGGSDVALLATLVGGRWTHPSVRGFGQPQQVRDAFLTAADVVPGGGNLAIGSAQGRMLLLHRCA